MANKLICIFIFQLSLFLISCKNDGGKEKIVGELSTAPTYEPIDSLQAIHTKDALEDEQAYNEQMLVQKQTTLGNYTFKYGYTKYNDDKYGWTNPATLEVLNKGRLIFTDTSIKGYEELNIVSSGYHDLNGKSLVFRLDYGLQACDYMTASRYYVIMPDGDLIYFIGEYHSSSGDAAGTSYKTIFPEEANGQQNSMLIVESLNYKEGNEPDEFDTTDVYFIEGDVGVRKLSNHIHK